MVTAGFGKWYASLGTLRQWHWISSALCLAGMLLFAVTGITLNHAARIPSTPAITTLEFEVPAGVLETLAVPDADKAPLPDGLRRYLADAHDLFIGADSAGEWDDAGVYVSLPRPGGDAWLSLDLETGELIYERTTRGWISYVNDLHKGRNTGAVWSLFLDLFAVACVVFCITGLLLLHRQSGSRPMTWPITALGLVGPLLLVILFVHP